MDRICHADVRAAPKSTASSDEQSDGEESFINDDTPRVKKSKKSNTDDLLSRIVLQNEIKIEQKNEQLQQKQQTGNHLSALLAKLIEKSQGS